MQNRRTSYYTVYRGIIACLAFCLLTAGTAFALNTPAGTTVTNTVSISSMETQTVTTGNTFKVDRAINVVVKKIADANIAPNSSSAALSFLVSNASNTTAGNAAMRLALSAVSKATNTTWTMNNVRIYRDNNSSGTWDAGDTLYSDASTFGDIASGASITVLIVADAPAGVTIGQTASYDLVATAVDAGTLNVSTQTAGPDTAGVDTVFRDAAGSVVGDVARDGKHSDTGTFIVFASAMNVNVDLTKTVTTLHDQWGGFLAIPGATLRYMITATITGSGTAKNVVISDPLPMNTEYIANTLRLNDTALTDAADTDAGDVGVTTPNAVTVKLGNLTSASSAQKIIFDVKIL